MTDLIDFLQARLDEDEVAAKAVRPDQDYSDSEHQDRWTPARALAEVDAKRRIIELHKPVQCANGPENTIVCASCGPVGESAEVWWHKGALWFPCETLQTLALPYADHPDYDDQWRP